MQPRDPRTYLFGTLQGRLTLSVAAVHAMLMTLFILNLTALQRAMLLDSQEAEAVAISQALATSAAGWIATDDGASLQKLVEAERQNPEMLFALFTDEAGRVLAHTDASQPGLYLPNLPQTAQPTVLNKSAAVVEVAVPAMLGNQLVGWVQIGLGQKATSQKLAEITRVGGLYTLAAVAIGAVIAWGLGRRITQRLYAVQDTISEVKKGAPGVLTARSKITGTDEAASIAHEVNALLDTLAERDQAFRQSETQYHLWLQSIHAAVVVHGPDTRILMSNLMAQTLLGLTEDQLLGKTAVDPAWHFLREDDTVMPTAEYPVNQVFATHQPLRDLVVGVHRPGQTETVWVLANADPVAGKDHEISQVVVTFTDITKRKRAEAALRVSEEKYHTLFEESFDGLFITSPSGTILDMNKKGITMFGYDTKEEILRLDLVRDVYAYPPDRKRILARVNTHGTAEYEVVVKKKNGEIMTTHCALTAVKDETGAITSYRGIIRDMTEHKQAEEALREQHSTLRSIIDSTNALIFSVDQQYRYTSFNQRHAAAMQALYGAEIETGQSLLEYLTVAEDREKAQRNLDQALGGEQLIEEAYSGETARARLCFRVSHSPIRTQEGVVIGAAVLSQDITADKRAEEQLRQSEQLWRAVFSAAQDVILLLDKDYTITAANDAAERTYGRQVTGLNLRHLRAPETRAEIDAQMQHAVADNGARWETWHLRANGSPFPVEVSTRPFESGGQQQFVHAIRDITERKRNEALNASRLHLVQFSLNHSLEALLEETLNEAERLTGSLIGFYHFVEADQQSLTLQNWSTRTKAEFCKAEGKGLHYAISEAGVWVDCVHQRQAVVHNDYASLPHRKGMPEGHAAVVRELVVPVFRGEKIAAILGVGNKPADYSVKDVEAVSLMADLAWEIAERKRAEEAEHRLNRELRAISDCNQTLMRAVDEQTLLNDVCRIICDGAGYRFAWVGYAKNDEAQTVHPTAWAGVNEEYLSTVNITWADTEHGHGPTGRAIRTGESVCIQDFSADPQAAPWREQALRRGYRSSIALPLKDDDARTFGVLNIYSAETQAFNPAETRLMEELAGDLAFGLTTLRMRTERKQAEALIQTQNEQLRAQNEELAGQGRELAQAEADLRALNANLEQRVLERTAQLEMANKELEAFAYSVSHDLRAPLRHIDGFLQLLQERTAASLDDQSQHYMANIASSARHMGRLIDDLLSFSRMGRSEMAQKRVDLDALVREVIRELRPEADNREIQWQIDGLPPVTGDQAMLHIVLVNLITNALKFTRPRERARIEIGCVPGAPDETVIFVRDNGVGFDMHYAGKLFGVFQRLHRAEDFEGTGIGLATVRRIILRHGGRTWAEGTIDQGATVFFSLPCRAQRTEAAHELTL
jgi:PAS domain S-box-containing protein